MWASGARLFEVGVVHLTVLVKPVLRTHGFSVSVLTGCAVQIKS